MDGKMLVMPKMFMLFFIIILLVTGVMAGLPRATYMQQCRTMADLEPDQEIVALYGALSRS